MSDVLKKETKVSRSWCSDVTLLSPTYEWPQASTRWFVLIMSTKHCEPWSVYSYFIDRETKAGPEHGCGLLELTVTLGVRHTPPHCVPVVPVFFSDHTGRPCGFRQGDPDLLPMP